MRMWQAAALIGLLALAAGCTSRTSPVTRPLDPAARAASTVMTLERTSLPVTTEQAGRLLPLFRALRGMPATDRPAADALVRQIDKILTDAQREELRRARSPRRPGGPGAPPGPGGSGQGGFAPGGPSGMAPGGPGQSGGRPSGEQLAAFRGQILDRAIALLEARVQ